MNDLELQRARAARNQATFREVNERIDELNARLGDDEETPRYLCECLDPTCTEMIAIPHLEYQQVRRDPMEFIVAPGHENPAVEEIAHRDERWLVVRKIGAGAAVARELASRSGSGAATRDPEAPLSPE